MAISRREVLKGAGALAGLHALGPLALSVNEALAAVDPATRSRYRLVIMYWGGGNDGLNTVVPLDGPNRLVYDCVRSVTRLNTPSLLPLDRNGDDTKYNDENRYGLNPNLRALHRLYTEDRLAVVQGVDYPQHSYSHFTSNDIWQSGDPAHETSTGWIGRHLDRVGSPRTDFRALFIGANLPLALRGATTQGMQLSGVPLTFADGTSAAANSAHAAYGSYVQHAETEPLRRAYGEICETTVSLVNSTVALQPGRVGTALIDQILAGRELLTADLGVEVVMVATGGFDTHDNQATEHAARLVACDQAVEAFFYGTRNGVPINRTGTTTPIGPLDEEIASRTILMTFSEFGRRLGDNGSGTDHGAAAPMFLVGPPKAGPYVPAPGSGAPLLVPGLHSLHPQMTSSSCGRGYADNLYMTADLRSVYQALLRNWLHQASDGDRADEGDPAFKAALGGRVDVDADGALVGLFGRA